MWTAQPFNPASLPPLWPRSPKRRLHAPLSRSGGSEQRWILCRPLHLEVLASNDRRSYLARQNAAVALNSKRTDSKEQISIQCVMQP